VDVIVTAMGSRSDKHDQFWKFMTDSGGMNQLDLTDWLQRAISSVFKHRPSAGRANDLRAVTLFDLEDFKKMWASAQVCGPDGPAMCYCDNLRAEAVRPLLQQPTCASEPSDHRRGDRQAVLSLEE